MVAPNEPGKQERSLWMGRAPWFLAFLLHHDSLDERSLCTCFSQHLDGECLDSNGECSTFCEACCLVANRAVTSMFCYCGIPCVFHFLLTLSLLLDPVILNVNLAPSRHLFKAV